MGFSESQYLKMKNENTDGSSKDCMIHLIQSAQLCLLNTPSGPFRARGWGSQVWGTDGSGESSSGNLICKMEVTILAPDSCKNYSSGPLRSAWCMVHPTRVSCRETGWGCNRTLLPLSNMEVMSHVLLHGWEAQGTWWPTRNEQTGISMWFESLQLMSVNFPF